MMDVSASSTEPASISSSPEFSCTGEDDVKMAALQHTGVGFSREVVSPTRRNGLKRRAYLWIPLIFIIIATFLAIFGLFYGAFKLFLRTSDSVGFDHDDTEYTEQRLEFTPVPLLSALPLERLGNIETVVLMVSPAEGRIFHVASAGKNYDKNTTTISLTTGEQLIVTPEMGELIGPDGKPLAAWNFSAIWQSLRDGYDILSSESFNPSIVNMTQPEYWVSPDSASTVVEEGREDSVAIPSLPTVETPNSDNLSNPSNVNAGVSSTLGGPISSSLSNPIFLGTDGPIIQPPASLPLLRGSFESPALYSSSVPSVDSSTMSPLTSPSSSSNLGPSIAADEATKIQDGDLILTGFPMPMSSSSSFSLPTDSGTEFLSTEAVEPANSTLTSTIAGPPRLLLSMHDLLNLKKNIVTGAIDSTARTMDAVTALGGAFLAPAAQFASSKPLSNIAAPILAPLGLGSAASRPPYSNSRYASPYGGYPPHPVGYTSPYSPPSYPVQSPRLFPYYSRPRPIMMGVARTVGLGDSSHLANPVA